METGSRGASVRNAGGWMLPAGYPVPETGLGTGHLHCGRGLELVKNREYCIHPVRRNYSNSLGLTSAE